MSEKKTYKAGRVSWLVSYAAHLIVKKPVCRSECDQKLKPGFCSEGWKELKPKVIFFYKNSLI